MTQPTRLGAVSYLNTLPLIEGLGACAGLELTLAAPSRLLPMLESGDVDLALAPVVDALRSGPELEAVPAGAIGSGSIDLWVSVDGYDFSSPFDNLLFSTTVLPELTLPSLGSVPDKYGLELTPDDRLTTNYTPDEFASDSNTVTTTLSTQYIADPWGGVYEVSQTTTTTAAITVTTSGDDWTYTEADTTEQVLTVLYTDALGATASLVQSSLATLTYTYEYLDSSDEAIATLVDSLAESYSYLFAEDSSETDTEGVTVAVVGFDTRDGSQHAARTTQTTDTLDSNGNVIAGTTVTTLALDSGVTENYHSHFTTNVTFASSLTSEAVTVSRSAGTSTWDLEADETINADGSGDADYTYTSGGHDDYHFTESSFLDGLITTPELSEQSGYPVDATATVTQNRDVDTTDSSFSSYTFNVAGEELTTAAAVTTFLVDYNYDDEGVSEYHTTSNGVVDPTAINTPGTGSTRNESSADLYTQSSRSGYVTVAAGNHQHDGSGTANYRFTDSGSSEESSNTAASMAIADETVQQRVSLLRRALAEATDVEIVAVNNHLDLALLRMEHPDGEPFDFAPIETEERIEVGQTVFAIGNPLGLEQTMSQGVVSTKQRSFDGVTYIQTDTAVNPGNSGGPLFNTRGEIVGITNMKIPAGESLNFAIPARYVKDFVRNREAFAFDEKNPNSGHNYHDPPARRRFGAPPMLDDGSGEGG